MIEVRNLTVAYGEYIVLDNVNLKIKPGQMTIIVGSSGCGKSVLMRTILGLKIPQNGEVFLFGENLFSLNHSKQNEMRKKISMLFQSAALLDSMNVFQNVALPAVEHLNLSEEELSKLVQEKLQLVGLRNVQEKYPAELSGGMRKRVGLARAIILEPEYIIYDEPTTGLDPIIAGGITKLIKKLDERSTSIVVTHDLKCIEKLGGRIVMLDKKKIIFDGSYEEFKSSKIEKIRKFIA
jgi:phospholipid/cholesterol/gamma-HCH transport system ATP-binding protein